MATETDPVTAPLETITKIRPNPTCDWGSCSNAATKARLWIERDYWLPVCDECAAKKETPPPE